MLLLLLYALFLAMASALTPLREVRLLLELRDLLVARLRVRLDLPLLLRNLDPSDER